jgi:DNA repair protein RecN (Recombination protein N)
VLNLLTIRNFAIIDAVEVEFSAGLSVLTGETGAGKSILVDALGLALGGRADSTMVRAGKERAEISAAFDVTQLPLAGEWLAERSLDAGEDCLVRRVVSKEGRSRAFINGQPVTRENLRQLASLLVEIHGQHAYQSLAQPTAQRRLLDFHGQLEVQAAAVAAAYGDWRALSVELESASNTETERAAQLELWHFQTHELESLGLAEGEVAELKSEHARLANSDRLASGVNDALSFLYEADSGSAHDLLGRSIIELEALSSMDPAMESQLGLLREAEIQVQEVSGTLRRYQDGLESDPARLEYVEERLGKVRELARKHHVEDEALASTLEALRERIAAVQDKNASLAELASRVEKAREHYVAVAEKLSKARRRAAGTMAKAVTGHLHKLGMPNGVLTIEVTGRPTERWDSSGLDDVRFDIAANPGQPPGPVAKVASGGELSRISLAIQVVAAGATSVPVMVFDEVDAGIGGSVAEIVGQELRYVASDRQVLCVTHLPQVASQGQHHFRVAKLTDGETTRTLIRSLNGSERVEELSRMLGGVEITERTRAHAQEMIARAEGSG